MKYWVNVTGNKPQGSVLARKAKPHGGNFVDIGACLGLCCDTTGFIQASPGNFAAADGATGHILLSWSAVTGAATYKLERATDAAFTAALTTVQNTSGLSKNDTTTSGVHYYYRLSVIDSTGGAGQFAYADHVSPA